MEVNQSIREYILMGHSYEEAKELSAYEIALKEQLKNQKINMRERPIKMARVIHKQGISITCKDHLGNVFPSLKAMTKHYGVSVYTYQSRLRKGWSKERALTTAVKSRQVV